MNIDWKFIVGDIVIPIAIFIAGFIFGGAVERHRSKNKSKIKGNNNTVIQGSNNGQRHR